MLFCCFLLQRAIYHLETDINKKQLLPPNYIPESVSVIPEGAAQPIMLVAGMVEVESGCIRMPVAAAPLVIGVAKNIYSFFIN